MKKALALSFSLLALTGLVACGKCCKKQTPCVEQKECGCTKDKCTCSKKRISGVMSEKEISWTEADRK